jgi:VWFA-related protein
MLRVTRVGLLLLVLPRLFAAEAGVSYAQVTSILNSAIAGLQSDAQIAHRLAGLQPGEPISDLQKEALLSRAPGPRTRDVLQILVDASAFVEAPPAGPTNTPPLTLQSEIMQRATDYTARHLGSLPDFICTRLTRRFDDFPDLAKTRPEVWQNLRLRDTDAGQLTYNQGRESFLPEIATPGNHAEYTAAKGLTSFGEFGNMLAALFVGHSLPRMTWSSWETIDGKRLAVFHYAVSAMHSDYRVGFCCAKGKTSEDKADPEFVTVAYRGQVFIDPEAGAVWRITRQALDLPADFPTKRADTIVDYRPVQVAGRLYMSPVRSTLFSDSIAPDTPKGKYKIRHLNDSRFVRYHRFEAESRLLTEAATAAAATVDAARSDDPEPWLELDPLVDDPHLPAAPTTPATVAVAQPPGPVIRASTYLVEVPVVVKDKAGKVLTGLKKEDFIVEDNGVRQDVRLFLTDPTPPATASSADVNPQTATPGKRVFTNSSEQALPMSHSTILLIDKINTDWSDLAYARLELLKFLRQLPASEPIALYIADSTHLSAVAELGSHAGDILERLTWRHDPITSLLGTVPPQASSAEDICRRSLQAMSSVAHHLAPVPGRKNVIWISAGFPMGDPSKGTSCFGVAQAAGQVLNAANVAIYSVDAPGLVVPYGDAAQPPLPYTGMYGAYALTVRQQNFTRPIIGRQASLLDLAGRTGGRAFLNANDLLGAIQTAVADPDGSYRLGFYPDSKGDGHFHRLTVRVPDHPEVQLRYRTGYVDDSSPRDKKGAMLALLFSPVDSVGIPLTADLSRNNGQCVLSMKIGLASVGLKMSGGRWKGRLDLSVIERKENAANSLEPELVSRLDQTFGLDLKQETYDQDVRDGFPYRHPFVLKPGTTFLRVAVREPESGAAGSLTIRPVMCLE